MGLDIEARDPDGTILAELRINVWDYVRRAMWKEAMEPYHYGGKYFSQEHIEAALERLDALDLEDIDAEQEYSQRVTQAVAQLADSELDTDVEMRENPSEETDRVIDSYEQIREFLEVCRDESVERIKVI